MLNKINKILSEQPYCCSDRALLLIIAGTYTAVNMEVDVFPDLNALLLL